jgi:hypothetical protein
LLIKAFPEDFLSYQESQFAFVSLYPKDLSKSTFRLANDDVAE